ncbi:hypothetical protein GCM10022251_34840 [Phytohabitans flavus]
MSAPVLSDYALIRELCKQSSIPCRTFANELPHGVTPIADCEGGPQEFPGSGFERLGG